jgi:hypothetical protein
LFVFDFAIETKALTHELTARFSTSHLMDAMRICYPHYWLQGDSKDNFNKHLMLIKAHCCLKKLLELVKTSKASSSLVVSNICPIILFTSAPNMQSNIFKIIMQYNVAITMEAQFHVNPLTRLWWTLETSHI